MLKPYAPIVIMLALGSAIAFGAVNTPRERLSSVAKATPRMSVVAVRQEIELGQLAAESRERHLDLLADSALDRYMGKIVQRLASAAPGPRYPYQVKIVNNAELDAFSFRGGMIYVSRGFIAVARTETELAAVVAHEMAHVAMRDTTACAFNGDNEYEADAVAAAIMARAGYEPAAMADFLAFLRDEDRKRGSPDRRPGSDTAAVSREQHVRDVAGTLWTLQAKEVGGFARIRAELSRSPTSGSTANVVVASSGER